jgi:hypothetical protein
MDDFADAVVLYQAYGDSADWRNFRGDAMPTWPNLPDTTKEHWRAAAEALRGRVEARN